uniref:cAMP-dependent protein kinase inhibitor alpha-like isoform X1 n=1 Tax=Myxine glutinosa TaxID=7769 RepID=UPI00358E56EB
MSANSVYPKRPDIFQQAFVCRCGCARWRFLGLRYEEFLADMTDVGSAYAEFVATGRSGRRNAVPDIRDSPAGTDSPELHQKLSDLSLTPEGENEAQIASNSEATKQEESGPT